MRNFTLCLAMLILLIGLGQIENALAVRADQVDRFEDGTTQGWISGKQNPNPPVAVPTGGPEGEGDGFLQIFSTRLAQGQPGSKGGPGSKSVTLNQNRWAGDYIGEGITVISAHVNYLSGDPDELYLRVAFRGANDTWFSSTDSIRLPKRGSWEVITFPIEEGDLSRTSGRDNYTDVMNDVEEFRILSSENTPGHQGDEIQATLGVDNLTAGEMLLTVPTAVSTAWKQLTTWGKIKGK